jgi:nicotinic acid mononucleotide adenylyltransferase
MNDQTKKPVVLISTGTHNPPHAGHMQMLLIAKQAIEQQGYNVIQTLTSSIYKNKVKNQSRDITINGRTYPRPQFTDKERKKLWQQLLNDQNGFHDFYSYESKATNEPLDHPDLFKDIIHQIKGKFPENTIFVYVGGEDLVKKSIGGWFNPINGATRLRDFICIAREDEIGNTLEKQIIQHQKVTRATIALGIHPPNNPTQGMSSTKIMQGDIEQLKHLPYTYLLALLNIIQTKSPSEIDPHYKNVLLSQLSHAFNILSMQNSEQPEFIALKAKVDQFISKST